MPHAKTALLLMMACALPGAVEALGLGEIHVSSALNEPLAAEVGIVGATSEDITSITATLADRETFQRFGIERPGFLSSATFRIAMDRQGQPVLVIRSTEFFTEPLINMLIDLRWRHGEVIRQYTLLLDPVSLPPDTRVASEVPAESGTDVSVTPAAPREFAGETPRAAREVTATLERARSPVEEAASPATVRVAAGATLHAIAARVSSGGASGVEKTMIAIFRANPESFAGNINRLRAGATLTVPSFAEVEKISAADANQEVRAQMESWRTPAKLVRETIAPGREAPAPEPPIAAREGATPIHATPIHATPAPAPATHPAEAPSESEPPLDRRVMALEQGFDELHRALAREQETLNGIEASVAHADKAPAAIAAPAKAGHALGGSIAAILALAGGTLGMLYARRSRQTPDSAVAEMTVARVAPPPAGEGSSGSVETPRPDANAETTPLEALRIGVTSAIPILENSPSNDAAAAAQSAVDTAKLRYLLLDADGSVHHVPMPSSLSGKAGFKERRTSLVDALKVAVEREPQRMDLRVKLLQTYYAAAASSRQGFLDIAHGLAEERANMTNGEWGKIAEMGRQIAADDDLFAPDAAREDDEDLVTA